MAWSCRFRSSSIARWTRNTDMAACGICTARSIPMPISRSATSNDIPRATSIAPRFPDIDKWCTDSHGKAFADLDGAAQDAVLSALEKGQIEIARHEGARVLSSTARQHQGGIFR